MPQRKRGRPPHEPTKEQRLSVRVLAMCGVTQEIIARFIKIDADTLRVHYSEELAIGLVTVIHDVGRNMYRIASTGQGQAAVSAGRYILGCRAARVGPDAAWKDTSSLEVPGGLIFTISKTDAEL